MKDEKQDESSVYEKESDSVGMKAVPTAFSPLILGNASQSPTVFTLITFILVILCNMDAACVCSAVMSQ